jgi:pilus assembly protein CpaC
VLEALAKFVPADGSTFRSADPAKQGEFLALVAALRKDGLMSTQAEPTIETLPGNHALYHDGGEFGYPDKDSQGKETTTFREYGNTVEIDARLEPKGQVLVNYNIEISELQPPKQSWFSWLLGEKEVPGLTTCSISTTEIVASGQTVAFRMSDMLGDEDCSASESSKATTKGSNADASNKDEQRERLILLTPTFVPIDKAEAAKPASR